MTEEKKQEVTLVKEANHLVNERIEMLLHSLRSKENFKKYRNSLENYLSDEKSDVGAYFEKLSELHKEIFNNKLKKNTINLRDYVEKIPNLT